MKKRPTTACKDRMIHIRLDADTHKRLKLEAVHRDSTVQGLVEALILSSISGAKVKDVSDEPSGRR